MDIDVHHRLLSPSTELKVFTPKESLQRDGIIKNSFLLKLNLEIPSYVICVEQAPRREPVRGIQVAESANCSHFNQPEPICKDHI